MTIPYYLIPFDLFQLNSMEKGKIIYEYIINETNKKYPNQIRNTI